MNSEKEGKTWEISKIQTQMIDQILYHLGITAWNAQ